MLLPYSFRQSGFHAVRDGTYPIARFQVFGEPSSDTNFIKCLIGRNTALDHSDEMGWKHAFAQILVVPRDMAGVSIVHNLERWALSMFAKP